MTAPDGDRLPATNSGQETYPDRVRTGQVDPYCPEHGHLSTAYSTCSCPAPQQPPAQEREGKGCPCGRPHDETFPVHQWAGELGDEHCTVCGTTAPPDDVQCFPPSEADSAGEDGPSREDRAVARGFVRRAREAMSDDEVDAVVERIARDIATERALAASSGVQGGDGEARERLAAAEPQQSDEEMVRFTLDWLAEVESLADKLRAWLGPAAHGPIAPHSRCGDPNPPVRAAGGSR